MQEERCDYTIQADCWQRKKPINISDFVAKVFLISQIKSVIKNKVILDAGCGEGYISRQIANIAKSVVGVDLSKGMIKCAKNFEKINPLGIKYFVNDVKDLKNIKDNSIDVYISSMVVHYLTPKELSMFYSEIKRVLKKNGCFFILTVNPEILNIFENNPKKGIWVESKEIINDFEFYNLSIKTITDKIIKVGAFNLSKKEQKKAILENKLCLTEIKDIIVKKKDLNGVSLYDNFIDKKLFVLYSGKK